MIGNCTPDIGFEQGPREQEFHVRARTETRNVGNDCFRGRLRDLLAGSDRSRTP